MIRQNGFNQTVLKGALSLILVSFCFMPATPASALSSSPATKFSFSGCSYAGTARVKTLTNGDKTKTVDYELRLKMNAQGACVRSLQKDLNAYYNECNGGYPGLPLQKVLVNGQLGTSTIAAIRDYQNYRGIGGNTYVNGHRIVVNGVADLQTWAMLHDNTCSAVTG